MDTRARAANPDDIAALTCTERSVLEAFGDGFTRSEMATILSVSPRTVGHALTAAKEKLGARSLAEAAVQYRLAAR